MTMKRILVSVAASLGLCMAGTAWGQCDTIATLCEKNITAEFIPDGQFYRALLREDEVAEFELTLFGGTTYRVAACSGLSERNLIFSMYDKDRNLLFSNKGLNNEPYWDFAVANTLDVIVNAELDPAKASSGCAVLLIGFRQ